MFDGSNDVVLGISDCLSSKKALTAIESGVNREYTQTCSSYEIVEVNVSVEYGHLENTISLSNVWWDRVSFASSVGMNRHNGHTFCQYMLL